MPAPSVVRKLLCLLRVPTKGATSQAFPALRHRRVFQPVLGPLVALPRLDQEDLQVAGFSEEARGDWRDLHGEPVLRDQVDGRREELQERKQPPGRALCAHQPEPQKCASHRQ